MSFVRAGLPTIAPGLTQSLSLSEMHFTPRKRQRAFLLGLEQAYVFDRDRCLSGEGLEKRNLPIVERPHLRPSYKYCSDGGALAQQRRRKRGVPALAFHKPAADRVFAVLRGDIMDMKRPTIVRGSSGHRVSVYRKALAAIHGRRTFPV